MNLHQPPGARPGGCPAVHLSLWVCQLVGCVEDHQDGPSYGTAPWSWRLAADGCEAMAAMDTKWHRVFRQRRDSERSEWTPKSFGLTLEGYFWHALSVAPKTEWCWMNSPRQVYNGEWFWRIHMAWICKKGGWWNGETTILKHTTWDTCWWIIPWPSNTGSGP